MNESENAVTYGIFSTAKNKKLIAELEAAGAKLIKLKPFETEGAVLDESALALLTSPTHFDWIVFTDVFAAEYFLEKALENGVDLFGLDDVRICACGEAVSDRLRFAQIHTDVAPNVIEDAEIVAAIESYVNAPHGLRGQKILIVRCADEQISLIGKLNSVSAEVSVIEIYRIGEQSGEKNAKTKALLTGGAIDDFIFSAPEDLIYLKKLAASEQFLSFGNCSATNETIFRHLQENGFAPKFYRK